MVRVSTADLCDLYSDSAEHGLQVALPGLQSFGGIDCLCGPAYTVSCRDDNALIRESIGEAGEGRILVIDGRASTSRALLGDVQAARAMRNGWGGIVVHGYVRDRHALARLPFGVFALGTVPLRPLKACTGEIGGELKFLNLTIRPGSWVYADADGTIVLDCEANNPRPSEPQE